MLKCSPAALEFLDQDVELNTKILSVRFITITRFPGLTRIAAGSKVSGGEGEVEEMSPLHTFQY